MKYLIWLVVALAVVVWLKRAKKTIMPGGMGGAAGGASSRQSKSQVPEVEHMVQCAHCNIHFPASEAVTDASGQVFCSVEHLRLSAP